MVITGTGLLRWLPACQAGDVDLIPGLGRSPGKGNDNPLQYSHLGILWTEEPSGLQSQPHFPSHQPLVTSILLSVSEFASSLYLM